MTRSNESVCARQFARLSKSENLLHTLKTRLRYNNRGFSMVYRRKNLTKHFYALQSKSPLDAAQKMWQHVSVASERSSRYSRWLFCCRTA